MLLLFVKPLDLSLYAYQSTEVFVPSTPRPYQKFRRRSSFDIILALHFILFEMLDVQNVKIPRYLLLNVEK